MKSKTSKKGAALVLAAALTLSLQTASPLAAVSSGENAQAEQTAQENTAADTAAQEPAMPESYEWEIQSNKIPGWPQGPKIIAETGIVMDLDSGEILYAKGIDEKRAPASITKIMTAMLAIEKVPLDTKITFTNEVNNIEPGSTHIGIKPGETLTMEESLYGILLGSANEVSSGVAEYIGGTVQAFVDMMNERAQELGCKNTHFVNANGLYDDNHYTTARDMALIAQAAFQNKTFQNIVKTPYYIIPPTNITAEERWINNHHQMLLDGDQHYDGCLGGKTGYTVKAGNTLVTYAQRDSMRLVCVVLKGTTEYYNDTRNLLDYGFNSFQKLQSSSETGTETDSLAAYLQEKGLLDTAIKEAAMDIPKEAAQDITIKAQVEDNMLNLDFYYGDTLMGSSSQEASQEIQDAAMDYDSLEAQSAQEPETQPASADSDKGNLSSVSSVQTALGKYLAKGESFFQDLPDWKYPVLGFLAGALSFYIILLIIKILRALFPRTKKNKKEKGEENIE